MREHMERRELPPVLNIYRSLAFLKADAFHGAYWNTLNKDSLVILRNSTLEFAGIIAEIKSEAFQDRLVDLLMHTFAVCDCSKCSQRPSILCISFMFISPTLHPRSSTV